MNFLLKPLLKHFGKRYDYDVSYMMRLEDNAPGTLLRYFLMTPLAQYRRTAPPGAYYAAKLVAGKAADCGPCVRLVCNMAAEAGVDRQLLLHVLRGDDDALPDDVRDAVRFAHAVVDQNHETLNGTREAIHNRWGEGGVADLSLAIAFGGFFPTMKRGLGDAQACEPIVAELELALNRS